MNIREIWINWLSSTRFSVVFDRTNVVMERQHESIVWKCRDERSMLADIYCLDKVHNESIQRTTAQTLCSPLFTGEICFGVHISRSLHSNLNAAMKIPDGRTKRRRYAFPFWPRVHKAFQNQDQDQV